MDKREKDNVFSFLRNDGEMSDLVREKDWHNTPAGPPENWTTSLKTTLSILFNSRFPMLLFWGKDLICFYNDAFRPTLGKDGKHPDMLGMPAEACWRETWTTTKAMIDQILTTGLSFLHKDQLIPIYRNGRIEEVYWTYCYSPVTEESGRVEGVLVTCTETTDSVVYTRDLKESKDRLTFAIDAAELGTWDYNPETRTFSGNHRVQKWFGLNVTRDTDLDDGVDVIVEEDRERVMKAISNALNPESGGLYNISYSVENAVTKVVRKILAKGQARFDLNKKPYKFAGTMQDITEQHNSKERLEKALIKLEESEKRFRTIADTAPVFIRMSDAKGNLTFVNRLLLDFTGKKLPAYNEKVDLLEIHPDDLSKYTYALEMNRSRKQEYHMEYRIRHHSGDYRWISENGVPEHNEEGKFAGFLHASMDIQDIKDQEKQKDLFIGMTSHELKTPLTTLKGYVQLLNQEYGKDEHDTFLKSSLEVINRQTEAIRRIVEELLDLARMKSGALSSRRSRFGLNAVVEESLEDLRLLNPGFTFSIDAKEETEVTADKLRIKQVLNNLLTNAVKYSPDSKDIHVKVSLENGFAQVSVAAEGIDNSDNEQKTIFHRFYRVDGENEKTFPGFGIGLFIASEIIREHHGEIGVISNREKGSTFYFTLPLD